MAECDERYPESCPSPIHQLAPFAEAGPSYRKNRTLDTGSDHVMLHVTIGWSVPHAYPRQ